MREPVIRRMALTDVRDVADFHRRTVLFAHAGIFPPDAEPPTVDELREEWKNEVSRAWIATTDSVVGTVTIRGHEIRRLLVDPSLWRCGLGTQLLNTALAEITTAGHPTAELWVLEQNQRARRFYERLGWTLAPGDLFHRTGVREVRYQLELPASGSGG